MTLDGFITLLTLLVAGYTVMTGSQRLKLHLRLGLPEGFLLSSTFLVVCYLQFYPLPEALGFGLPIKFSGITPKDASFVVIIICAALLFIIFSFKRTRASHILKIRNLTNQLVQERKFSELVDILEDALPAIHQAYRDNFFLPRVRRLVEDPSTIAESIARGEREKKATTRVERIEQFFARSLRAAGRILIPNIKRPTKKALAAREVVQTVLLLQEMSKFVAENRPRFAISLFGYDFRELNDFTEMFFTRLLEDKHSTLYFEIRQNQNTDKNGYAFPSSNRILHYLFADAKNARRLEVYRPIGEFVIREIRKASSRDLLNSVCDDHFPEQSFHNPIFVGIRLFDLMVTAAIYQNVRWHMWLYYYPHFTREILSGYSEAGPGVDVNSEWPTNGSYIIYSMFDAMRRWIRAVNDLPAGQENRVLERENTIHENGNPVKSSILAYGQCLKLLVESSDVGDKFKLYIFEMTLRLFQELRQHPKAARYLNVLLLSIAHGGPTLQPSKTYGAHLVSLFDQSDHVLRSDTSAVRQSIVAAMH